MNESTIAPVPAFVAEEETGSEALAQPTPDLPGTTGGMPRPTKGRALIVEDEVGLAEVLALHLEGAGFEAVVANDGLTALYELDRATPRVVLLDLHLPEVSGFRLIQLLKQRANEPQLPVIVITALSFQEAEEAVRAGADDFVTKPFTPAEIVTRVERLLERVGG